MDGGKLPVFPGNEWEESPGLEGYGGPSPADTALRKLVQDKFTNVNEIKAVHPANFHVK